MADFDRDGRPDLVVRFRRGFGEPSEETAKKKEKENETPPVRKTPADEMNAVLRSQYPLTSMPVAISLSFLDTAQYGGTLTTSIKVGTSSLTLEPQGDAPTAVLDMAGFVLNDQGKSVSTFNKRFTIRAAANNPNGKPPETIFYNHFALIKPGLYQVRVAALDVKAGTRGSAYEWIEIPNVANKELTLSSLIIGEKRPENEVEPVDLNSKDPQQPAAIRQVVILQVRLLCGSSLLSTMQPLMHPLLNYPATPQVAAEFQPAPRVRRRRISQYRFRFFATMNP